MVGSLSPSWSLKYCYLGHVKTCNVKKISLQFSDLKAETYSCRCVRPNNCWNKLSKIFVIKNSPQRCALFLVENWLKETERLLRRDEVTGYKNSFCMLHEFILVLHFICLFGVHKKCKTVQIKYTWNVNKFCKFLSGKLERNFKSTVTNPRTTWTFCFSICRGPLIQSDVWLIELCRRQYTTLIDIQGHFRYKCS